jgi:hypothetical protein
MLVELRISRCVRNGLKWTFAVPLGELAHQVGDHVDLWTTRDASTTGGYRLHWRFCQKSDKRTKRRGLGIGRNARVWKLTETGNYGLCHPILYQPNTKADIIVIPNYPQSTRKLYPTTSNGVYSAPLPKWNNSAFSNYIIKATDKAIKKDVGKVGVLEETEQRTDAVEKPIPSSEETDGTIHYRHVTFNPTYNVALQRVCDAQPPNWRLLRVVQYHEYECVAVFEKKEELIK